MLGRLRDIIRDGAWGRADEHATDGSDGARFIVASSSKLLGAQAVVLASSLAVTVYLAHELSKREFATLVVYALLAGLMRVTTTLGLDSMVVQQVPGDIRAGRGEAACSLMKTAFFSRLSTVACASLVVLALAGPLSVLLLDDATYSSIIRLMVPGIALLALADGLKLQMQAVKKFGGASLGDIAMNLATIGASITLYLRFGLEGYYVGCAVGPLVACVSLTFALRRYVLARGVRAKAWLPAVRYSLPYYLRGYLRYALLEGDRLVVSLLLPAASLAEYGLARRIADYVHVYGASLTTPALIKLGELRRASREELALRYRQVTRYGVALIGPACLLAAAFSPVLMETLGGPDYRQAWPLLAILSLAQLLYFTSQVYGASLVFVLARPGKVLLLEGVPGAFNLGLSILLVSALGVDGMAWSQAAAYALSVVLASGLVWPFVRVGPDWAAWALPLSLCAPALVAGLWSSAVGYDLVASAALGLAALILGLCPLSLALRSDDWQVLRGVVPARALRALGVLESGARRVRAVVVDLAGGA